MTRLVLHVGPAKCGSTSIQQFFSTQEKPCVQNTRYTMLEPSVISALNCENPNQSILTALRQLLITHINNTDVFILSHEYLFQCPSAIEHICRLAKDLVAGIAVIGYSRRQSEFLTSAYTQWLFRDPDTVKAAISVIEELGLEPALFSGLERQIIASIEKDFYNLGIFEYRIFDWYHAYKNLSQTLSKYGAVIRCGVLPDPLFDNTLIEDFCEKSGLHLNDAMNEASQRVFNSGFDPDIVEAMNNGVVFGLDMPGPHESNEIIALICSRMAKMGNHTNTSGFFLKLKSYIDTYFLASNQRFCEEYGLCEAYFAPSARYGKPEILAIIRNEGGQRTLNKSNFINGHRMLSAKLMKLCIEVSKAKSPPVGA